MVKVMVKVMAEVMAEVVLLHLIRLRLPTLFSRFHLTLGLLGRYLGMYQVYLEESLPYQLIYRLQVDSSLSSPTSYQGIFTAVQSLGRLRQR